MWIVSRNQSRWVDVVLVRSDLIGTLDCKDQNISTEHFDVHFVEYFDGVFYH